MDVLRESREWDLSQLTTKADLFAQQRELRQEIAFLRQEITSLRQEVCHFLRKAELAEFKADVIKWMLALLIGQAVLIAALVKLL